MRAVLLGMNNPHGRDVERALHPLIAGSAGAILYAMVVAEAAHRGEPMTLQEYLQGVDRDNLLQSEDWSRVAARQAASDKINRLRGRRVVVLGSTLPSCLGLRTWDGRWYVCRDEANLTYSVVPHPSGLNRVYNDPSYRQRTGAHVLDLIRRYQS